MRALKITGLIRPIVYFTLCLDVMVFNNLSLNSEKGPKSPGFIL